jgi:hypothetical protein
MKHALRTVIVLLVAAATATLQDKDLKAQAKAMSTEVTRIRGLKFKKEVKVGLYNRDQLKKFLLGELDKEFPKERAKAVERVAKKFGVIPESLDLRQAVVDLLTSSIGGFYHLKTKELRMIGGEEASPALRAMNQQLKAAFGVTMDDITLAHELCHAAQDQTFELISTWPLEEKHEDDLVSALKAVIEGDATLLGWSFGVKGAIHTLMPNVIGGYKSGKTGTDADKLPAYLRKGLLFPYAHGTDFVYSTWKAKGDDWKAITDLLRDPPLSTEQVLHRDKYETRDHPQRIAHPELEKGFEGGKLLDQNVMGEYGVLLTLEELGAADSAGAAAGWDGDRYWAFDLGGKVAILWFSTWDSEEDAREFAEAYAWAVEKKYAGSKREGDSILLSNGERATVVRRGADVFVVDSAASAVVDKALGLWGGFKKTEVTKVPAPPK